MKGVPFVILFTLLFSFPAFSESPLDAIKDRSLELSITTKVLEDESTVIWNVESSEVTVSGEEVTVKLNGDNIIILAEITPYLLDDGSVLLVAKGDVILSSEEDGLQYKTTLKSLPVTMGEKAYFFPLGLAFDSRENIYTIQLEIQVNEFSETEEEPLPKS